MAAIRAEMPRIPVAFASVGFSHWVSGSFLEGIWVLGLGSELETTWRDWGEIKLARQRLCLNQVSAQYGRAAEKSSKSFQRIIRKLLERLRIDCCITGP
jgi:hypothetical protein